jgi:oligosaccharide 4-alpha-D-glucosyltransferase
MKFCCIILLVLLASKGFAQTNTVSFAKGTVSVTAITNSITKVVYTPNGFADTVEISDAVILSAQPTAQKPTIRKSNDILIVNNVLQIVDARFANDIVSIQLALQPNEKIFGGGERAIPLNRRGYAFNLNNNPWYDYSEGADELNYSVPFFTSSNGYAILFNNPAKGRVDIGKTNSHIFNYAISYGPIIMYVIKGNNYASILQQYHQLTGTQPLPPKWALGNFMSRFGYTSTQQVDSIYNAMKTAKIPMDAIIFDLFWFGDSIKKTMGNLQWVNKKAWPNPAGMIKKYADKNIKTILITEPFVLQSSLNYQAAKQFLATDSFNKPFELTDFYFGNGGVIDIFRKDAVEWFWQQYQQQNKIGVAGWWGDLGEPEKHPNEMLHNMKDWGYNKKLPAYAVHNLYGHAWTKMLHQQYAKHYPNTRLFSLNRSGFAGTQRYNIFPWTGDVSRSWSGLRAQLPLLQSMSMCGIPYVHSDAGGFAGGEGDYELYIRWLQMAMYTPIFRPHGTALYNIEPAAYSFPSEPALMPEPYKTLAKNIVVQRYQWLPYNYTLAFEQATQQQPFIRPLYYMHPTDSNAYKFEQQYYWGNNILVAPILQPKATQQTVYLPNAKWYALNSSIPIKGNNTFQINTAITEIPVFVKAGSFLPLYSKNTFTTTTNITAADTMNIHYYAATEPSNFTLFADDGVSKNSIAKKQFQLTSFATKGFYEKKLQITVATKNKFLYKQQYNLVVHTLQPVNTVLVNGKKLTNKQFHIHNQQIHIPFTQPTSTITIQLQ